MKLYLSLVVAALAVIVPYNVGAFTLQMQSIKLPPPLRSVPSNIHPTSTYAASLSNTATSQKKMKSAISLRLSTTTAAASIIGQRGIHLLA